MTFESNQDVFICSDDHQFVVDIVISSLLRIRTGDDREQRLWFELSHNCEPAKLGAAAATDDEDDDDRNDEHAGCSSCARCV